MAREISQRELRNNSGEIMRQLDHGESFVVTRNGVPVGELSPLTFDTLPSDDGSARAYGRIYTAIVATGRRAPRPRAVDVLIAATSLAAELPLYTRNVNDFRGIEQLLTIVGV